MKEKVVKACGMRSTVLTKLKKKTVQHSTHNYTKEHLSWNYFIVEVVTAFK